MDGTVGIIAVNLGGVGVFAFTCMTQHMTFQFFGGHPGVFHIAAHMHNKMAIAIFIINTLFRGDQASCQTYTQTTV